MMELTMPGDRFRCNYDRLSAGVGILKCMGCPGSLEQIEQAGLGIQTAKVKSDGVRAPFL